MFVCCIECIGHLRRKLPGDMTVEIFSNKLIGLIENHNNSDLKLNVNMCDQALLAAQRCAQEKSISHTAMIDLWYQEKFQAEYIFASGQPLDAKIVFDLLGQHAKTENELMNIRQLGIGAATTADTLMNYYVLRIYPVRALE